jgi:predicted DNA-binding protein with PD1-like motif
MNFKTTITSIALFCLIGLLVSCNNSTMNQTHTFAFRLKPGEKLKESIQAFVMKNNIKAGYVATCVGSLTQYNIRFANQPHATSDTGHFEIASLTGTLSSNGSHMHISVSDHTGKTIGGHLMENCIVYTTAEIVIVSSNEFEFIRKNDGTTPWEELQVIPSSSLQK